MARGEITPGSRLRARAVLPGDRFTERSHALPRIHLDSVCGIGRLSAMLVEQESEGLQWRSTLDSVTIRFRTGPRGPAPGRVAGCGAEMAGESPVTFRGAKPCEKAHWCSSTTDISNTSMYQPWRGGHDMWTHEAFMTRGRPQPSRDASSALDAHGAVDEAPDRPRTPSGTALPLESSDPSSKEVAHGRG